MSDALVEARDGILIITINRPDAKNAMNKEASELIAAALDRLDAESDLRCAIQRRMAQHHKDDRHLCDPFTPSFLWTSGQEFQADAS